jgi:iron-sulfur cluster protein
MARRDRAAALRRIMSTEGDAVGTNTRTINDLSKYNTGQLPEYDRLRAEARSIKESAIEDLPALIDAVRSSVEGNGGHVHLVSDDTAANARISELLERHDVETVAKSKSMTTEEIDLNGHLRGRGLEVHETDLGEFVIDVAGEEPSHLIGPAIHRTPDEIADLFNDRFDLEDPLSGDPQELTEFARREVGDRIRAADAGITGANFVVAETGTIALVTNEGNARKTAVTPPVHVAVAGVEKLVPELADLQPFVELIARTGTGQDITSYLSLLSPPVETPTVDFEADEFGPAEDREFHLVLLDNGRMAMRDDEDLRETLYCIRCGACANSCANFQSVGGHAFGGETYTGGIATGWEAGVEGLDSAATFNDLCTGCSRCVNRCPVNIDIPWINSVVRNRIAAGADADAFDHLVDGLVPDEEPAGLDRQKRLFGNVDRVARLGSRVPRLANYLGEQDWTRALLDSLVGIDPRRELPEFATTTFREWYGARGSRLGPATRDREVVLYPDVYTDYFLPERGEAAVRILETLGVEVHVPAVGESGRAPLSQGMIRTARERARSVYGDLADDVDAGRDVVVLEPSDLAMFRADYANLLPERSAQRLAENSYGGLEYVYGLVENGADLESLPAAPGDQRVIYHGHCQERTLGLAEYATTLLERVGYDVGTTDVECCGMAGSFGYKSEYYEVSVDVGERLADDVGSPDDAVLVAPGASCREQIEALVGGHVEHPVALLDPGRDRGA